MERERKEIGKKNDEGCSRVREKRGEKEAEGHRVTGKDESEREIGETRGNVKEKQQDRLSFPISLYLEDRFVIKQVFPDFYAPFCFMDSKLTIILRRYLRFGRRCKGISIRQNIMCLSHQ